MGTETPGQLVRRLRDQLGLSREKLAQNITLSGTSLSASAIVRYEADTDTPRPDKAKALDEALRADGLILDAYGYATPGETASRLAAVERLGQAQALVVERLGQVALERLGDDDELAARLAALERLLDQQPEPADAP